MLRLANNTLSGEIFVNISSCSNLLHLDLQGNDLHGNKKLCGGIPQLNLSRCTTVESGKLKYPSKMILIIALSGGFLGVILLTSFVLCYCLRKRGDKPASASSWGISFRRVAYQDLLQATNEFSSASLIGVGNFGSVYRGILPPDGMAVAVKVLNLLQRGASSSSMADCTALINIRHRNLFRVISACSSIDFQGNDFKAIVYELMVKGSLEEWLHPIHHQPDNEHELRSLNLIMRLNISIDVANALKYLHEDCHTPIIHCDLKPSSVLLDDDMTACVGDFGLAGLRPEVSRQIYSDQTSSVGLKGTIGYAAPEYGIGSDASTCEDVYSFGILLLETFKAKRPTDGMFKDGLNLHKYAEMALPDRVMEVVDPVLLREYEESSVESSSSSSHRNRMNHIGRGKILECLISIMKVGVSCSVELPPERMYMSNVVSELQRIRDFEQPEDIVPSLECN